MGRGLKGFRQLVLDPEFERLIPPLSPDEYRQLEDNIMDDGCRDPLTAWGNILIDGHNRYAICNKHGIPYQVNQRNFDSREDVIAWICANQLGRRNISEETRKYLIGKQYEAEKWSADCKNPDGNNQHRKANGQFVEVSSHRTARRIAQENNISHNTVHKYAQFSRALETVRDKEPTLASRIMAGKFKVSHENLQELARMSPDELSQITAQVSDAGNFVPYMCGRKAVQRQIEIRPQMPPGPSVKDMPTDDADSEIAGMTLTIPSWISSLERVRGKANFPIISATAKQNLISALNQLQQAIEYMLSAAKEEQ